MSRDPEAWVRWSRLALVGVASLWFVVFAAAVVSRIGFPLELEWMEGGALQQAWRMQQGKPTYAEPSAEFVPYLYPPLYPTVLATLGSVLPLDYWLGRLVSVVSIAAILGGIWRLSVREAKPVSHRLAGMALFVSGYVFCFRWYDLARADAMALALMLWAAVLLREAWGDRKKALFAGLCMVAAVWTKQTAVAMALATCVCGLLVAPRQLWVYVATLVVGLCGGLLIGQVVTDGWLWVYVYELHQSHSFNHERFVSKSWGMLVHAAPILSATVAVLVVRWVWPWLSLTRRLDRHTEEKFSALLQSHRGFGYWGMLCMAALLVSSLSYSTQWAESNAFMPAVCFGAAFLAVALPVGGRAEVVAVVGVVVQLVFTGVFEPQYAFVQHGGLSRLGDSYRWSKPRYTFPPSKLRANANTVRAKLESGRPVLAIHRPWWSILSGGPGHAGSMNLNDIGASYPEHVQQIQESLGSRVLNREYQSIWLDGPIPEWLRENMATAYVLRRRYIGDQRALPMTGFRSEAGMLRRYVEPQLEFSSPRGWSSPKEATVIADFEDGTAQGFTFSGAAFSRGPAASVDTRIPAVGPIGGEFLLSSAASRGLKGKGEATSPSIRLGNRGTKLGLLVGYGGERGRNTEALSVKVVEQWGDRELVVPLKANRYRMREYIWEVPAQWAHKAVQVVVSDTSAKGAVFVDHIWLEAR